ncbi:MAG: hypothetical protein E6J34_09000 [Chloroflexi bacterium]|nr:MAG: hypothetical protein E6J34_09000 [Chloroflexota bacterium]
MSTTGPRPNTPLSAQPSRDAVPRRIIVTASVAAFAIRDWSLWVLLREGPWGPPMRLVLGSESVSDAVDRTLDALLMWPMQATLVQLRAGWQEQQVCVWGSAEQGTAISLIHSVLLRANRDELRPNLHRQPVPSLHVTWVPVAEIETGQKVIDANVLPGLLSALHMLRSQIQHDPGILLRYLADMSTMRSLEKGTDSWWQDMQATASKETRPLNVIKEPPAGDGTLTLAEAALLYRAFLPPEEQIDLSSLRRRFLATNKLVATDEERSVRGREADWRRVSRAYRYLG